MTTTRLRKSFLLALVLIVAITGIVLLSMRISADKLEADTEVARDAISAMTWPDDWQAMAPANCGLAEGRCFSAQDLPMAALESAADVLRNSGFDVTNVECGPSSSALTGCRLSVTIGRAGVVLSATRAQADKETTIWVSDVFGVPRSATSKSGEATAE